ncbi:hypothetical protein DMR07_10780 [Citrobacter freundii]|uniref:hypothetical protein n=1 Tax=Citrobacter freundii TaxID=546 RepID=UPI000D748EEB|nr:hypothetical protein [Citrobacter freundii]PXH01571.1 hypothetical protein DMR07_10780 [Citrobacter freundii]
MEETNFTPGPWHVSTEGKLIIRDKKWLSHIAFAGYATNDEEFATARLIAAAPELLEALQLSLAAMNELGDILNFHDMADAETVEKLTPAFEMARAAINKALGKEQS